MKEGIVLMVIFHLLMVPAAAVQAAVNVTGHDIARHSFLNKMCITSGLLCDELNESENRTGLICPRGPGFDALLRSWC
jgi:hypothetical protein